VKTPLPTLLTVCFAAVCLIAIGCGKEETTTVTTTPPPPTPSFDDHDHKHGPNGFPVVDMDDGTEVEFGFDKEFSMFTVMPPVAMDSEIEKIEIKTVTDGTEKVYAVKKDDWPGSWVLEDKELGTAMLMEDAVERTLIITKKDGSTMSAPVAPAEGH